MENISNPFKMVNISVTVNILEIGSLTSRQAKKKGITSALSNHPKFSQPKSTYSPPKITETTL